LEVVIEYRCETMSEFGQGDRVRVDIPDETDPDHERFHGQHGIILRKISDDAGSLTDDDRDSVVYRVELDPGETRDFRRRDLRPPLDGASTDSE
jgi:ribosomal protein L21E